MRLLLLALALPLVLCVLAPSPPMPPGLVLVTSDARIDSWTNNSLLNNFCVPLITRGATSIVINTSDLAACPSVCSDEKVAPMKAPRLRKALSTLSEAELQQAPLDF